MSAGGPAVLVTDGEQRAALAVTRSLGAAGYRVIVASRRRLSLAAASRYAARRVRTPDPAERPDAYAETIEQAARKYRVNVIVPVTEAAMLALLPRGRRIGDAVLAGPTLEAFEAIRDKALLLRRAAEIGIAVPDQILIESVSEPTPARLDYPVAVKPARSMVDAGGGHLRKVEVRYANDSDELRHRLEALPGHAYPVLVQRFIQGPGIGIFLLLHEGRPLARFAHRRIREKPPSGGVSVCCESVHAEPSLLDASVRLLRSFDWQGPAMVEYKLETATGTPFLMEVNGRFWGSLQLALHAGVDFPRLLVDAALGRPLQPVEAWRTGVRNHWEWGEVDGVLIQARAAGDRRGRAAWNAMRQVLDVRRGRDRTEVFRLRDPLPFLVESAAWLQGG